MQNKLARVALSALLQKMKSELGRVLGHVGRQSQQVEDLTPTRNKCQFSRVRQLSTRGICNSRVEIPNVWEQIRFVELSVGIDIECDASSSITIAT